MILAFCCGLMTSAQAQDPKAAFAQNKLATWVPSLSVRRLQLTSVQPDLLATAQVNAQHILVMGMTRKAGGAGPDPVGLDQAARLLGVSRRTLERRVAEWGTT